MHRHKPQDLHTPGDAVPASAVQAFPFAWHGGHESLPASTSERIAELSRLLESEHPHHIARWLEKHAEYGEMILREANSVNHALLRPIRTVEHAVIYLGRAGLVRLAERLQHAVAGPAFVPRGTSPTRRSA